MKLKLPTLKTAKGKQNVEQSEQRNQNQNWVVSVTMKSLVQTLGTFHRDVFLNIVNINELDQLHDLKISLRFPVLINSLCKIFD